MNELLFVYGTLMESQVQQKIIGRSVPGEPDSLAGYEKDRIRLGGGVYPIVRPRANSSVEGVVIAVSPAELELIDQYETDAYRREKVVLASGRRAWVYRE